MRRRVAVMVPHFLIAPHVVASDLVLTLAGRVAEVLAGPLGLAVLPAPRSSASSGSPCRPSGTSGRTNDPAHRWLRGVVEAEASAI